MPEKEVKKKVKIPKHRDIGIDVEPPMRGCKDPHCPFHGTLSVRGQILEGTVMSISMTRSAVVKRDYLKYVPKYERYEKRSGRYVVHAPDCIAAAKGDHVKIMECRPLSKTKSFVIVEKR